jgi:Uma2 family endonuclease
MYSGWIASQITRLIAKYTLGRKLGFAATEIPLACFPFISHNHGRKPDAVCNRREVCGAPDTWVTPMRVMPNLPIEVLSLINGSTDIDEKLDEHFEAGAELAWVVNPKNKTVRVYRPDGTLKRYRATDTLTGEHVIPGFECKVADFFPPAE